MAGSRSEKGSTGVMVVNAYATNRITIHPDFLKSTRGLVTMPPPYSGIDRGGFDEDTRPTT